MNLYPTLVALAFTVSCIAQPTSRIAYPVAAHSDVQAHIFGNTVTDPFRSLEDDTLSSTVRWLEDEHDLTKRYMDRLINKFELRPQFQINSHIEFPSGTKAGHYYFHSAKYDHEAQASLYISTKINGEGNRIVDPAHFTQGRSDDVTIQDFALSDDDQYLAFSIAHRGSDWQEIHVKSVSPDHLLKDVIDHVRFSDIAWQEDGFYYIRYQFSGDNSLKGRTDHACIYYHKLGTAQTNDALIYRNQRDPSASISFQRTALGEYLIISDVSTSNGEHIATLRSIALKGAHKGEMHTIVNAEKGSYDVVGIYNQRFLVQTNLDAPRGRLLLFSTSDDDNSAEEFVPQYKEVLHDVAVVGDKVICTYLDDISYASVIFDTTGKIVNSIHYPDGVSVSSFSGTPEDSVALVYYYSFLLPPVVCAYNVRTFSISQVANTNIGYDHNLFEVEKVHYQSTDGVTIPMMIAHKKGLKMDGSAPTILYGYGGNGVVMTPFFSRNFISHLQNGGIVALPCIRGGGEFGHEWHKTGARESKQQVFDDFIAAANYLFALKYTSSEKLALMGGSNGGLLVAAVVNQRPDICKAVIADRGVYDMLRFEQFTAGHFWQNEYGYNDDSAGFNYMYKYSPLHNVAKNVRYPAILVITADHDDRVVPLHAYKYTAALQESTTGPAPVLLYVAKNAGHNTRSLDEDVLVYSFIYEQLGVRRQKVGLQ